MNKVLFVIPVVALVGISIVFLSVQNNSVMLDNPHPLTVTALKATGSPVLGNDQASITIIEYGDYQCTYCYRFHQSTLKTLESDYIDTGRVNLIFKDFPLNGEDSVLAAQASHCADKQGVYWEYHNELYENWGGERTGWITHDSLTRFAVNVMPDTDEFDRCLDGGTYRQKVLDMYAAAQAINIDATPSFLVFNDQRIIKIVGNQPLEVFIKSIDELTN